MNKRCLYFVLLLIVMVFIFTACTIPGYVISLSFLEKGNATFDQANYQEALVYYEKALKANPKNATAFGNKSAALNFMERFDEALDAANKAIEIAPREAMFHLNKGDALNSLGQYDEALISINKAIELDAEMIDSYISKGTAYYYLEQYEEALTAFDKAIQLDPNLEDAYLWKVELFAVQKKYEQAIELSKEAIKKFNDADSYYKLAQLYVDMNNRVEAIKAIDKAIAAEVDRPEYYLEKLSMLYNQRDYDGCIAFAKEALKRFPETEDINWYIGDCYSEQLIHDKAAEYYLKEFDINPSNDQVAAYAAWAYFYLQDYPKAEKCAEMAHSLYGDNYEANTLLDELRKTKLPEAERIVDFVKTNYLYLKDFDGFEEVSRNFIKDNQLTLEEINAYIESIRKQEDIFSYVISGEEYSYLLKEDLSSQVSGVALDQDVYYIKIDAFTPSTGYAFWKELQKIEDASKKNLIIDLRGNFGGLIESSNQILDFMLPDCTTSYTIDRNGYIDSYHSDDYQMKFKKVLILVDKDSASSSELLALGLKKYLNNVVIIGKPTFGKGVGQNVYEDKKKGYMIFLVSFYWNVLEENIAGNRIYPDVSVKADSWEAYQSVIKAQLDK